MVPFFLFRSVFLSIYFFLSMAESQTLWVSASVFLCFSSINSICDTVWQRGHFLSAIGNFQEFGTHTLDGQKNTRVVVLC